MKKSLRSDNEKTLNASFFSKMFICNKEKQLCYLRNSIVKDTAAYTIVSSQT